MMRNAILLLALFCAACSSYTPNLPSIRPYRMDIQQGNVVTAKMMMQLKPGMTKSQVRYVMGTPLIMDSFHPGRWDYFYSMKKDGRLIEQRRVILDFENDALARVRGDVIPAGSDAAATAEKIPQSVQSKPASVTPKKEKGLLDKLKFWGDDKKLEQPQEVKATPAAQPDKVESSKSAPVAQPEDKQPQEIKSMPAQPEKAEQAGAVPKLKAERQLQASPAVVPEEAEAPQDAVVPQEAITPKEVVVPQNAVVPQEEKKGLLEKLKFWGDDKKAEPKSQPAAVPATKVEQSKPLAPPTRPAPVAEPAQPTPVPETDTPLPPEDDPTYFERMLERIGF